MGRHESHTGGRLNSREYMQQRVDEEVVSGQIVDLVTGQLGVTLDDNDRGRLIHEAANMIERYPKETDG